MIIIVASRDADDHVKWLLQHGYFEKALAAAEEGNAKSELLEEVWRCPSLDSASSLSLPIFRRGFCIYTLNKYGTAHTLEFGSSINSFFSSVFSPWICS